MTRWLVMAGLALAMPLARGEPAIAPFSGGKPGAAMPGQWRALTLPHLKSPEFAIVDDAGVSVLRIRAESAAGSLSHSLDALPGRYPVLSWRWKIDRVVEKADLARKEGDDYAARVYVMFDVPESELTLAQRVRLKLARLVHGTDLPAAAICYVWDNSHPPGTSAWNAYSDRMRMVVVRSGRERLGQWVSESRDVDADFRAAFGPGWTRATPRVLGVAVASDTDQTHESVTAWFGDLSLGSRP